ncbi:putative membrane protein [Sphingomonas sp. UYAg733]
MASDNPPPNPPVTASVGGNPIHSLLAAFPLAFFTGAFVTDIIYANTAEMMWANFSIWLITGGLIMGVFAGIAGLIDFIASKRIRRARPAWPHSVGNALVLILSLFNAFVHSRDGWTSVVPTGIILSGIVTVLVIVTSWLGALLVYRHRVGVA